jgi:hypothetical protein
LSLFDAKSNQKARDSSFASIPIKMVVNQTYCMEWIFSIGLTPKQEGISFVPKELPPFLHGSNPIEKTTNHARPTFPMKIVVQTS